MTKTRKDGSRGRLRISYGDAKDATGDAREQTLAAQLAEPAGSGRGRP